MIRTGTETDLDAICSIEKESYARPWTRAQLAAEMKSGLCLVRQGDPAVEGYVFFRIAADEMEVTNLAVAPAFRRKGVGKALLEQALDKARTMRVTRAFLDVRVTNSGARKLYESLGFREIDRRKGYYEQGEDGLVLFREI